MGDRPIPTPEEVSRHLYAAWLQGPSREQANRLLTEVPVPGSVGLRGRFMLLTDPQGTYPPGAFELDWATWVRQVDLTDAADRALVANELDVVRAAVEELIDSHRFGLHPLPVVDALVASGDAARQGDHFEEAAVLLDEARRTAALAGYQFGYMRATLSLAYLTVLMGSADDAVLLFDEAERIAAALDDRVLRAGALVGLGEAHDKAGRLVDALDALGRSLEIFESISSQGGIVNASLQQGDIYRRQRQNAEARTAFQRALDLALEHGPWVAIVNALDGLAEIELADGELAAAAERYADAYQRSLERSYRRGIAHAANGLGRVCFAAEQFARSIEMHEQARELFAQIDDPLSQSSALTGLADAHEANGDLPEAVNDRLRAVEQIETVRAAQDRHRPQQEFVARFRAVYRAALETAAVAQDATAFVAVFEGLGGRRLDGLLGEVAVEAPVLEAQMLAFAQADAPPTDADKAKRFARLLGRTALRGHLPHLVSDGIDDVAAALHRGFDPAMGPPLVAELSQVPALAICTLPGAPNEAVALLCSPGTKPKVVRFALPDSTCELVASIATAGLRADATLRDVGPLGALLPPGFDPPKELLIVPLEELWAVPWPAVAVGDGRVLGECSALTLAPSLTLATSEASPAGAGTAMTWRSPHVHHITIQALGASSTSTAAANAAQAKEALLTGTEDLVVLVAHGKPAPGVRHLLELDTDVFVTPVDLMTATVPARIAMISCWGAHTPSAPAGEPLTLATLASARGAEVLCTLGELADDALANRFVNNVLHYAEHASFAAAVQQATRSYLGDPSRRAGYLSRWAPIVNVGRRKAAAT